MLQNKKKSILSLFSCGGGMDIGFEGGFKILKSTLNKSIAHDYIAHEDDKYYTLKETAFETVFANDIVSDAKTVWADYFSRKRGYDVSHLYHIKSIVDIVKEYKEGNQNALPSNINIVIGGFPCQDFSVSGKRNGFNSHKDHNGKAKTDDLPTEETRGKLYIWMKEVIELTLPNIFIAENVKGLANLGDIKRTIQSDFSKIGGNGYIVVEPQILHAGRYGVPQSRERIFFIGFKRSALTADAIKKLSDNYIIDEYNPYPRATHLLKSESANLFNNAALEHFVAAKEVLTDLCEPESTDDSSQKFYSKAKFMGSHCQGQKEVDLNNLAPTIRSEHHGNIEFRRLSKEHGGKHTSELNKGLCERRLTLRECARIQTFPDDYNFVIESTSGRSKFTVSPSSAYKLVGNAVPPLLAYHIAKKIESNWKRYFGESII
ncbi:MAG: DNA (cytosine-5-)-methyltransferase [Rikenellaceae bacterium]